MNLFQLRFDRARIDLRVEEKQHGSCNGLQVREYLTTDRAQSAATVAVECRWVHLALCCRTIQLKCCHGECCHMVLSEGGRT